LTTNADQAGLVSYNSTATLDQKLSSSVQALEMAIHAIPGAGGNTSISLGLQTAQNELTSTRHNPQALPVLVLLSDGLPTGSDTKSPRLAAPHLPTNGVKMGWFYSCKPINPLFSATLVRPNPAYTRWS